MFLRQRTSDLESHRTDVRPSRGGNTNVGNASSTGTSHESGESLPPHSGSAKTSVNVRHTPLSDYQHHHSNSNHSSGSHHSNGTTPLASSSSTATSNSVSSVVR